MSKPIYKVGDKVEIVNYGHLIFESKNVKERMSFPLIKETEKLRWLDMSADLVGQEGIVEEVSTSGENPSYVIRGVKGKSAWYDEGQMKLVKHEIEDER